MDGDRSRASARRNNALSWGRINRDLKELQSLPSMCEVTLVDPADVSHLTVTICPEEGFYNGGRFVFSMKIGDDYPFTPPKVKCTQRIYHPNIDLNGAVCLNILREDWRPVLDIVSVVLGLHVLFLMPNPDDPLNHEAASVFKRDIDEFDANVRRSLAGGSVHGIDYDRVLISN